MMPFDFDALGRVNVQSRKAEVGTSLTHLDEKKLEECSCKPGLVEAARCLEIMDIILLKKKTEISTGPLLLQSHQSELTDLRKKGGSVHAH